jgi:hypothetical protein
MRSNAFETGNAEGEDIDIAACEGMGAEGFIRGNAGQGHIDVGSECADGFF